MIQCKQSGKNLLIGHVGAVIAPTVGCGDGGVELVVDMIQPDGALVVEVGQGALLEIGGVFRFGDDAIGKSGATSGIRSTHSGGLSQLLRSSLSRWAAVAMEESEDSPQRRGDAEESSGKEGGKGNVSKQAVEDR
ncbi:MAG: hypothetical protein R8J84_07880 [Mariprofundales bacterium]